MNNKENGAAVRGEAVALTEVDRLRMPKRDAFIAWAKGRSLNVTESKDAWGNRRFINAHIESMWFGWFHAPAAAPVAPSEPSKRVKAIDNTYLDDIVGRIIKSAYEEDGHMRCRAEYEELCEFIDDLCVKSRAADALDSQPTARPTAKQLIAQLHDGQTWKVAEQNAFAEVLACFPNESSQGIISLGDAWKHGQAYGMKQVDSRAPAASAASAPDGWISVKDRLPDMEQPVYLFEKGRGIWTGARGDYGDAWLWGHCYGTEYFNIDDGTWEAKQIEIDDEYLPTRWMSLPTAPQQEGSEAAMAKFCEYFLAVIGFIYFVTSILKICGVINPNGVLP